MLCCGRHVSRMRRQVLGVRFKKDPCKPRDYLIRDDLDALLSIDAMLADPLYLATVLGHSTRTAVK